MIIQNNGTASSKVIKQKAIAGGLEQTIGAEVNVNKNITDKLVFNSSELQKYYIYNGIQNHPNAKLIVGMDNVLLKSKV